jgi:sulfur carrier protein
MGGVKLTVNGAAREVQDGITVEQLLQQLNISAGGPVAVEVNTLVVRRAGHATHQLREGDQVEIVTFVGGG